MSNKIRKARKQAGEKFQPKPAKVPTSTYMSKSDRREARKAFDAKLEQLIAEKRDEIREGVDNG